jgi:hypothetical protein
MASGGLIAAMAASALVGGASAKHHMNRQESLGRKEAEAALDKTKRKAEEALKLKEQKEKIETANESVRKQKILARRRTIFAGDQVEENTYRKTLGGL